MNKEIKAIKKNSKVYKTLLKENCRLIHFDFTKEGLVGVYDVNKWLTTAANEAAAWEWLFRHFPLANFYKVVSK